MLRASAAAWMAAAAVVAHGAAPAAAQVPLVPPTVGAGFAADTVVAGTPVGLSVTLSNPNVAPLTGVSVSATLPAGLVIATPSALDTSCGPSTVTAAAGGTTIAVSGATLAAADEETGPGSCSVVLDVVAATTGDYPFATDAPTATETGPGAPSAPAALKVVAGPAFGAALPATVRSGAPATLTYSISNPNVATTLEQIAFEDTLPAGWTVAAPSTVGGTCPAVEGAEVSAPAGGATVALQGLTLGPDAGCTLTVAVVAGPAGQIANPVGPVTFSFPGSSEPGSGSVPGATASTLVVGPPTAAAAFAPAKTAPGAPTTLTLTLGNPQSGSALSGAGLSAPLPAGVVLAEPSALATTCSGGTPSAAGGTIAVTGATLAASSSCTVSVAVKAPAEGVRTLTTTAPTSTEGGNGAAATATLTTAAVPTGSAAFDTATVTAGGTLVAGFTITNPNATITLTGVGFDATLSGGFAVANPATVTNGCGGTATALSGGTGVALTGGTLAPGASCTVTVRVSTVLAGSGGSQIGAIRSDQAPDGTGAGAGLQISPAGGGSPGTGGGTGGGGTGGGGPAPPKPLVTAIGVAQTVKAAGRGVLKLATIVPGAGTLEAVASIPRSGAASRALSVGAGRVTYARSVRSPRSAGALTVTLQPTARARRSLKLRRNRRGIKVRVQVRFTPAGYVAARDGKLLVYTRTVTVKR